MVACPHLAALAAPEVINFAGRVYAYHDVVFVHVLLPFYYGLAVRVHRPTDADAL